MRVAAIVLAAGRSARFGGRNKLLEPLHGVPLVAHAVDAVLASRAEPVCVVLGHEAARVRAALADRPVAYVKNPDFADGLSTSLRAGIHALDRSVDGALVCLGDMPRVDAAVLDALIARFETARGRVICAPRFNRRRGNPVLWPAARFPQLIALQGDAGGRELLEQAGGLRHVRVPHDGVLRDVDTADDLAREGG